MADIQSWIGDWIVKSITTSLSHKGNRHARRISRFETTLMYFQSHEPFSFPDPKTDFNFISSTVSNIIVMRRNSEGGRNGRHAIVDWGSDHQVDNNLYLTKATVMLEE